MMVKQLVKESLREYMDKFNMVALETLGVDAKIKIHAFIHVLRNRSFFDSLVMNEPEDLKMAEVIVATDQQEIDIPEGILLIELVKIDMSKTRILTNKGMGAIQVKKNKIFNPGTLKKQWDPISFDELNRKINMAKLMKFITA